MCFDYEAPSVFHAELRRAGKVHRCVDCGAAIARGEQHHYVSGCTDGEWWNARVCLACERVRALVFRHEVAEGCSASDATCPYGELHEYVEGIGGIGELLFYWPRVVAQGPRTEVMSHG